MDANHARLSNHRVLASFRMGGAGRLTHLPRSSAILVFLLFVLAATTACGRLGQRQRPAAKPSQSAGQPSQTAALSTQPETLPAGTATAQPTSSSEISGIANLGDTGQALCKAWDTPKAPVAPGKDLRKLTLNAPNAICNDGSPAVIYIRPAQDPDKNDEWIFHLQGGGSCDNYEECRIRWCGEENYDAAKMSSRWTPDGIQGHGIFSDRPENSFAGANQVFLYYCSSDTWAGQKSNSVVTDPDDSSQQYTLNFHGHTIVEATLQILRTGAVSDDGQYRMPILNDATDILFTGTSGGSAGVTNNIDWLASQLDPAQTTLHAVMDANFPPDGTGYSDEQVRNNFALYTDYRWNNGYQQLYGAFNDQSCLAALGNTPQVGNCGNMNYLISNQITTPFFVRQDLQDPVISNGAIALGSNLREYGQLTYQALLALPNIGSTAAEASNINFTPGVYGPNCRQHVALLSDIWFLRSTVKDASGKPVTFHDALRAWLSGQSVLIVDTHPATLSTCEATEEGGG